MRTAITLVAVSLFGCSATPPDAHADVAPVLAAASSSPGGASPPSPALPVPVRTAPAPATASAASSSRPAPPSPAPPADTDEPVFETSGPLSASEERVLKAVVVCVRRAAERGAPSTKPLDVELAVEPSGAVSDVRLGAGYSRDAAACVKREVVKLTFVARPQGGVEFVRYPIAGIEEEDATDSSP